MWRMCLFALAFFSSFPPEVTAQADTLEVAQRAEHLLRLRYNLSRRSSTRMSARSLGPVDQRCDGGEGNLCHGSDPDRGYCPRNVLCHPSERRFLESLAEEALENPTSGFLMGQTVYAFTKFGFVANAMNLVGACRADPWWCGALRGYALHAMGKTEEAESLLREAMKAAPPDVRCSFEDGTWLLGEWGQRRVGVDLVPNAREDSKDWSCERRLAVSDTLWWMADPLFHDSVNDRWTEHVTRALSAQFALEIREAVRGTGLPARELDPHWAMHVRRGPWDSFEVPLGPGPIEFWTSEEAALYHFVPEVDLSDFSQPTWNLSGDLKREGFTPNQGRFYPVQVQLARFRVGDSLGLAAAADVMGTPLRRSTNRAAHLILSDAPGSRPLELSADFFRENPYFWGVTANRASVLSFEVVTGLGIGWERRLLSSLETSGPGISDLMLVEPSQVEDLRTPRQAVGAMLPSHSVGQDVRIGVFSEFYGAREGEFLELELRVADRNGDPIESPLALDLPGMETVFGKSTWTEEAMGSPHPVYLALDLNGLDGGDYVLSLRARWAGQDWLAQTRPITILE
ncbi:MAG: hypothetical protein HKO65_04690 [Gemmatimonadetes bacterium]|nr:hypothetical protein [Gemmatimonadota bacterium]NNM04378.1 hypothetical protein [Gemmatimonadota bacterium]